MSRRESFLSEMLENTRLPYEVECKGYVEDIVGEFESPTEEEYFQYTIDKIEPESVILDLACGDGRHTLRLAESVENVVGLDFSRTSLTKAKRKCLAKNNVIFIEGSMFQLPFSPKTFDSIWFSQAFEYVPPDKRRAFLTSLNGVLKDSGTLYMSVETWRYPSIFTSVKRLWSDFRLFCYWKCIRRKPLLWGEYLEHMYVKRTGWSGWHYHVHTSKKQLCHLLDTCGFTIEEMTLCPQSHYDEYIYVLCRKTWR